MLPAIGSLTALNSGGRLGVVVDARPPAVPADGRQLVTLPLRTVDQRDAQGQAAARVSGLAPLPAEATERPAASRRTLAMRDRPAAEAVARRRAQRSDAGQEELAPLGQPDAQLLEEESTYAALQVDLPDAIEDSDQRPPDGRHESLDSSVAIRPGGIDGDAAELERPGAGLLTSGTTPTKRSAQDHAAARRGLRVYAEAQSEPRQSARVPSSSPESDPVQMARSRGGSVDLTS